MRVWTIVVAVTAGVLGISWTAAGQVGPGFERATIVDVGGGVARDAAATGGTIGGSLQLDLTPHLAIEGAGHWLDRGARSSGFAAELMARVSMRPSETLAPYVTQVSASIARRFERRSIAPVTWSTCPGSTGGVSRRRRLAWASGT
jgi:hypothetical protein